MKLLVLVVTAALLFTAGDALNCHRCVPEVSRSRCELSVESCQQANNTCGAVTLRFSPFVSFQQCMDLKECEGLMVSSYLDVTCCGEDMCNSLRKSL